MRSTVSKSSFWSGLVVAAMLTACSGGGGAGSPQTTGPAPVSGDEETVDATSEGDGGKVTIGGEETGLTLEIPGEWIEVPLDADTMSEGLDDLDLPDDQSGLIESSIGALGNLDGAVMAVDPSTLEASVATNVNAYCVPNDGSVGESNLTAAIELGLGAIAEDVEAEETSVDGEPGARATYSLDIAQMQGFGVQYMFLNDGDICWVTLTGADEGQSGLFDEIAATISVL